jgi:hypothetical protein
MSEARCYIWNTPADEVRAGGDYVELNSPRAGGLYRITGTALTMRFASDVERALLTSWLSNQRRAGIDCPSITSDVINSLGSVRLLAMTERLDQALLYFRNLRVGEAIHTPRNEQFDNHDQTAMKLAAVTECISKKELAELMNLLVEMELLTDRGQMSSLYQLTPTAKGWLKIDELTSRLPDATQAFVAMWFNSATQNAYTDGIEPAIADCGYRAVRIDKKEHSNKIDDEIIAEIRRSKFLVADFTCEKEKVRGGVYFEAGFAMGMRIPVIWTVARASVVDLHFDTRQYNHIVWETPDALRSQLRARIGAVIGDGPLKTQS